VDRLEQQLRSVLTDERLDVHVSPGAVQAVHDGVRRRRRRNAVLSAAASFALVTAGIVAAVGVTQGGHDVVEPGQTNPTPTTQPSKTDAVPAPGLQQGVVVEWNPIAYDPNKPFALAGTTPDSDVPWCAASQLSLSATEFQGATGSAAGGLTLTNNGNVCAVQGSPALTGYDDAGKVVATSDAGDAFLVHAWVALQHGEQAQTFVQVFGDGSKCLSPVARFDVDLGHGISPLSVDMPADGVAPRCGTAPKGQQLDHYVVSTEDWTRTDGSPRLPMGDFSATISDQPTTVTQGMTINYKVLLSTRGASVDPCLPYREQLVSLDGTQTAVATSYFLLDCDVINGTAAGAQSYLLDMRLALPSRVPAGDVTLSWETPLPGQSAIGPVIHVNGVPAACDPAHLSVTGDGMDGAAGAYYGRVVFTNRAARACSLRGYPGVQFTDAGGDPLPTKARDPGNHRINSPGEMAFDTVILRAHGGTASFVVSGSDWMPPDGSTPCPTTKGLLVIAPGGFLSDQVLVTGVADDCNHEYIRVWLVVAGRHALAH